MYELVPADCEVPRGLEHERFRLRMLSIDDVERGLAVRARGRGRVG